MKNYLLFPHSSARTALSQVELLSVIIYVWSLSTYFSLWNVFFITSFLNAFSAMVRQIRQSPLGSCICFHCISLICNNSKTYWMGRRWCLHLQGVSLGKGIWRLCAAHTTQPPPPWPHWPDPRECRAIHLGSAWLQRLPEGSHRWHPAAWGTPLLICILDLLS